MPVRDELRVSAALDRWEATVVTDGEAGTSVELSPRYEWVEGPPTQGEIDLMWALLFPDRPLHGVPDAATQEPEASYDDYDDYDDEPANDDAWIEDFLSAGSARRTGYTELIETIADALRGKEVGERLFHNGTAWSFQTELGAVVVKADDEEVAGSRDGGVWTRRRSEVNTACRQAAFALVRRGEGEWDEWEVVNRA